LKDKFAGKLQPNDEDFINQRPTRDTNHIVSKIPAKTQDFGERKKITIDENEESNENF
jgi:hypothetical protein